MQINKRAINTKNYIIYLIMFLIGFNLMGYAIPLIYCFVLYCIFSFSNSKMVPKLFLVTLVLFCSMVLSLFLNNNYSTNDLLKIGTYPSLFIAFYLIANSFNYYKSGFHEAIIVFFYIVLFFYLGNVTHLVADVLITDLDSINMGHRVMNDIWSGGTAPTTIIVGWGVMAAPVLIMATINRKDNLFIFVITVLLSIIYIVFSFVVATRLGIVNIILLVGAYFILLLIESDYNLKKSTVFKTLLSVIMVLLIGYKLFPVILKSNLFLRLDTNSLSLFDSNGRFEASKYLIQHFFDHIWGGGLFAAEYGMHQHNILLQMYDLYGLVPFLVLIYILFISVRNSYHIFRDKKFIKTDRLFMLLLFTSLMLYYFEEPVISSNFIITSMLFAYLGYSFPLVKQ